MMTAVKDDVRCLLDAVDVAPEIGAGQRAAVHGLAGELLEQVATTDGLDLSAFLRAGVRLAAGSERPETPARSCSCDDSAWFDEVGIRERERRDEARETEHFNRTKEVGESIGRCGEAITEIVSTAETAVRELLAPAKRMLDIVLNCGITQLIRPAVDVVIEALRCARETASDRNCVIRECLGEVAARVDAAAAARPAPAVDFGGKERSLCDAATLPAAATASSAASAVAAASAGSASSGSADARAGLGLELSLEARLRIEPSTLVGTIGAAGAGAALGALDCITSAQQECPPQEPEPAPAPPPPPVTPPPPPPPPVTPVGEGVMAPPPELAQVEQPAPPPKKLENLGTQPAQVGGAPTGPSSGVGSEPWAMKKSGEW